MDQKAILRGEAMGKEVGIDWEKAFYELAFYLEEEKVKRALEVSRIPDGQFAAAMAEMDRMEGKVKICKDCGREITPDIEVDVGEFKGVCYSCYKMKAKRVCVDFDGVLAQYTGWKGPGIMGEVRPGAFEFLTGLDVLGYVVIVFTTRDPERVNRWLIDNGLIDLVDQITNQKLPAVAYIDDRALRFNGDFQATLVELQRFKPFWREG
jgi:hypothetical protein